MTTRQDKEYRLVELVVKFNLLVCELAIAHRRVLDLHQMLAAYSQQLVGLQMAQAQFNRSQFAATYGGARLLGAFLSPMLAMRTLRQRDQMRQELLTPRQTSLERDLRMQISTLEREVQGRQREMESLRNRQRFMAVDIMSLVHQLFPNSMGNAARAAPYNEEYEQFVRRTGMVSRANRHVTATYHPVKGWVWIYPEGPGMLTPAGLPPAQLRQLLPQEVMSR